MSVRSRTLKHLARALAMSTTITSLAGCDPIPPPIQTADDGSKPPPRPPPTDPQPFPPDGPPVVCDPMPAPYCEPNATSPEALAAIPVTAAWTEGKVAVTLQWPWHTPYALDGAPKITGGKIVAPPGIDVGNTVTILPDSSDATLRLTVGVACQGSTGTIEYDVIAGAPGSPVKITPHKR